MEVKDVKDILNNILTGYSDSNEFNALLEEFRSSSGYEQLQENYYLPPNLCADDDLEVVSILEFVAMNDEDVMAMKYGLVMLHHHFMLGDKLEKAFASKKLLQLFTRCEKLIKPIISEFIDNAKEDILYAQKFDEDDWSEENMCKEFIMAFVPSLEWFHNQLPDYNMEEIEDMMNQLTSIYQIRQTITSKLLPQPKFCAFGQYLYEDINSR